MLCCQLTCVPNEDILEVCAHSLLCKLTLHYHHQLKKKKKNLKQTGMKDYSQAFLNIKNI